jgi:hypothetical protein
MSMIGQLDSKGLMFYLLLLCACSSSGGGDESVKGQPAVDSGGARAVIVSLPANVGDAICSLTRRATERDLIAIFGEPDDRKGTGDMVLLSWSGDGWDADAMLGSGTLKLAGANAKQNQRPIKNALDDYPSWNMNETQRGEMEDQLGPGIRVGVQWYAGSDVAPSIRNSPNFDESMTRDSCQERYAWSNLVRAGFASFLFVDGILRSAN